MGQSSQPSSSATSEVTSSPRTDKIRLVDISRTASSSIREAIGDESEMHLTAREQSRLPGWEESFTFSVVRNPYSRTVSQFKHWRFYQQWPVTSAAFLEWLRMFYVEETRPEPYGGNLWLTQRQWLEVGGEVGVDRVFYFEQIERAWEEIQRSFGFQGDLPHKGRADDRTPWVNLYGNKSVRIVRETFRRDFESFGYNPCLITRSRACTRKE